MTSTITVLGATGGAGAAITRAAQERGDLRVRAVNRGGSAEAAATTERIAADIETAEGARAALGGIRANADGDHVVVLAAQPPYHAWGDGRFERLLDNVLAATAEVGGKLVFVDNLYAYDSTAGPITEKSPPAPNRKGRLREQVARRALAAHEQGQVRVTIGGFSDYFGPGPGADAVLSVTAIDPALAGRRMRALFELDVPHAFAYLPDVAEMFLTLALDDRADGHRWVLPHQPPVTQREAQRMVAAAAGTAPRHGRLGPLALRLGGLVERDLRELLAIRDQWEQPYEVDGSAFTATFGPHHLTPMDEAVTATVTARQDHDVT